jgi:hypothetical protein
MEEITPLEDNNINSIINLNENNSGGFATGIDYIGEKRPSKEIILPPIKKQTPPKQEEEKKEEKEPKIEEKDDNKSKTFFEKRPEPYDPKNLSLSFPVDIEKIKKNALNSINASKKNKLSEFLKNDALKELINALISDSFWFIVCFFQSKNENYAKSEEDIQNSQSKISSRNDQQKLIIEILTRISCNYFKFFIRVADLGPIRKHDSALNSFKNFMSHSVYYSIYLAFPKSRHLFNEEFRNRIVYFFTYLFNGLVSEKNFVELHWELDLGKGNIIENNTKEKDIIPMKLPTMTELQSLIDKIMNKNKFKGKMKKNGKKRKEEVNTDILNTPLYRIYAETHKFETLNLVKPIKMSNRKIIDIYAINKIHAGYVKFARDTLRDAADRKAQYLKKIREKEEEYQKQINEIKANEDRVKKELENIKLQRVQEYANYCIFLSK